MKNNILSKFFSLITIFAMTFNMSIAQVNQGNEPIPPVCDSQTFVSEGGKNGAVAVDPIHSAWTAVIDGAEWIWTVNPIPDATIDITEIFTITFDIDGEPSDSELEISADNQYKVTVNGGTVLHDDLADGDTQNYKNVDTHTILASDLITGENTIEIEVLNIGLGGATPASNPAGLIYKLVVNCEPIEEPEPPICIPGELISNGGFEYPVVTDSKGWDIFPDGTSGLGWNVSWVSPTESAPTANLELHRGVNGWLPSEGDQYAELDTDYFGSPTGGSASVEISQDIDTVPGVEYTVHYAFSPRPNTGANQNVLEVLVNENVVQTQGPTANNTNQTIWTPHTFDFVATGSITTISFKDAGTPDSFGTFLDDVSVRCDGVEPEDPADPNDPTDPVDPEYCVVKEFIETVEVNPDGQIYSSSISYLPGDYLLEANGTYKYRGGTNLIADVAFSERLPGDLVNLQLDPANYTYAPWYQSNSYNSVTGNTGGLGIWVNGNGPAWGTVFNPSHQYFHEAQGFAGGVFEFQITDNNYSDNIGQLTVDIYDCDNGHEEGGDPDTPPACEDSQTCEEEDVCTENCDGGGQTCEDLGNCSDDEEDIAPPSNTPSQRSSSGGSIAPGVFGEVLGDTDGEVLGACDAFSQYHKKGDRGGEVSKIQEFLNDHMSAGLKVDGIYGNATTKAVHAFQQKYFKEIISPWVPPLASRTTGRWYKSTRMMANEIIICPEEAVFLEDPQIIYKVEWNR